MRKRANRRDSLRSALNVHRQQAEAAVRSGIRHERNHASGGGDLLEQTDAHNQHELEFALAQMRAETLKRITEALARVDAGQYGFCAECDAEIGESRLAALPFAVRCLECAQRQEAGSARLRAAALPGSKEAAPFLPDSWP